MDENDKLSGIENYLKEFLVTNDGINPDGSRPLVMK